MALVHEHDASEQLHDLRAGLCTELVGDGEPIDRALCRDTHLDELVIEQRLGDLREHPSSDAALADVDERAERVTVRAQGGA